ncbi:MAG: sugar kinase [Candidatus Omnitrophica bacterium]|nr:sugar kinase [Candidatus Omnitrophota bacterium]
MPLMVVGTIALDDLKTPAGDMKDLLGGSASHLSMSASLFTKVHLAGIVGKDFPKKHMALFKRKGINVDSIVHADGQTFHWYGEYRKEDLNTAITLKTELGVITSYVPKVTAAQWNIPQVFLANIDPETQMKFLQCMRKPQFVGADTMNLWINTMKESVLRLMKKVNLFVLNDGEARMLTGETNIVKAAKCLRAMGPSIIVIKKGEHGVFCYADKFMFGFPAFPVENVVDPTGAGDTFAGGLMGYLSKVNKVNEIHLRQAVIYATICSSFNVEGFGAAKTSSLTLKTVDARRKQFLKFMES